MSGIINKVKDALHHDKDTTHTGTTGTTHTTGTHTGTTHGSTNAGPHDSNAGNKLDPRVDSDLDGSRNLGANQTTTAGGHSHTTTSGVGGTHGSTNAGPHSSNLANKLDPRVDSDLDGSRNAGANQTSHGGYGTTGSHTTGTGLGGSHTTGTHSTGTGLGGSHTAGSHPTDHPGSSGPVHSSNIANKLDPRVDSDRDGSRNLGMGQAEPAYGSTGTHNTTGSGFTGSHGTTGTHHGTTGSGLTGSGTTHTTGHSSNIANKADPRVDSDFDGSRNAGLTQTHGGDTFGHNTTGTHSSGLGGTTDGTTHGTTGTTGHGTSTGPHSSNVLNKLDPRVDSNLDGKAGPMSESHVEGFKRQTGETFDAAKHRPSVIQQTMKDGPNIAHGDGTADYSARHGRTRGDGHYGSGSFDDGAFTDTT